MYNESEDDVILKLKLCTSNDGVFNIINQFDHPNPEYLVQAFLVLRDLNRVCPFQGLRKIDYDILMKANSSFSKLAKQIINSVPQLNIDELSSCILYLYEFDWDAKDLRSLISAYEDRIKVMEPTSVSSQSLAQVCSVLETFHDLWTWNTLLNFFTLIFEKMGMSFIWTFGILVFDERSYRLMFYVQILVMITRIFDI